MYSIVVLVPKFQNSNDLEDEGDVCEFGGFWNFCVACLHLRKEARSHEVSSSRLNILFSGILEFLAKNRVFLFRIKDLRGSNFFLILEFFLKYVKRTWNFGIFTMLVVTKFQYSN